MCNSLGNGCERKLLAQGGAQGVKDNRKRGMRGLLWRGGFGGCLAGVAGEAVGGDGAFIYCRDVGDCLGISGSVTVQ